MNNRNDTSLNIGIIHLSDIHFTIDNNHVSKKWQLLFKALKDDFLNCSNVYIVVSGDVANSGNPAEYKIAKSHFSELLEQLKTRYKSTKFKFILTPGNHDCDFSNESQLRINTVKTINYETIGKDNSVINMCLAVQSPFWEFYSLIEPNPDNKMYYKISDEIFDKKVCFHCFNTAWMSQKKENPGTLFFPVKPIHNYNDDCIYDLNVAVFHHPLNWLNPKTTENNKNEFQHLLDDISSLQIIGHEHCNELRKTEDIDSKNSLSFCFSSDVLQDHAKTSESGFQTLTVNLDSNQGKLRRYNWNRDIYCQRAENEFVLCKKAKKIVVENKSFIDILNKLNIPLIFNEKQVSLSDIYIFPDLEKLSTKTDDSIDDFIDSERILDNGTVKSCILEGDSQIGKTSLLYMLFLKALKKGIYPLFIDG